MVNIFKKKVKITSHEKAIAVAHLSIRQNQLRKEVDDNPNEDKWSINHDIKCLEKVILYLENKGE